MNIESSLEDALLKGKIDEEQLRNFFCYHSDIQLTTVKNPGLKSIHVIYCAGMIDSTQLNDFYNPVILHLLNGNKQLKSIDEGILIPPLVEIGKISEMVLKVFSGFLIFYMEGQSYFHGLGIAKIPQRKPEESKVDITIKGPRDAFTEEVNVNVSLIRKRLKTAELYNETFTLGTLSQTKVSLMYLANKSSPETISEIKKRLSTFQSESIISAGQLEQWISDRTFSFFPLIEISTRPDFAVDCMMRGRFILLMDGSPLVLIGPANLLLLIKSPEDVHYPYYITMLQRALRLVGFLIAIGLPGFWVAITSINISQLPFKFLSTIGLNRMGIPLSVSLETLLILVFFELLREASLRIPIAGGQSVSIVGGLIIGDAVIRAGLASPTTVVVVSVTAVATYTLVNQSLTGTVSVLRILLLFISSVLGVYGFFIGVLGVLVYICRLESFHIPYAGPIVSLTFDDILSSLSFNPFKRKTFSAKMLQKWRK